ncbi:MAG: ABC transporter permease [Patescibacteria group bacterium]
MNNFFLPLKFAWQSLGHHRGRTFLTIVGIVIGIAAVIMVMSAGDSLKGLVLDQVESFGSDFIQVEVKVPSTGKNSFDNAAAMVQGIQVTTLKIEDAEAIKKLSNVKNYYAGITGQEVISYLDTQKSVTFMGISPSFIDIDKSKMSAGRFFSKDEDSELARVLTLGSKLAVKLFGNQDPVGKSVKLGKNKFLVVGVMEERGSGFGLDFDQFAYLPLQTAQKLVMGVDYVVWATVQVEDTKLQDQTAEEITTLLRERHKIDNPKRDDFAVTTAAEAIDMVNTIFGGITLLLTAIAGISLLVGGIGIMNIMYVSVSERTFEIGLRKAVGAKNVQILWQFLWEAIVVTVFGGIIGITLGILFSLIISFVAGQFGFAWGFSLPPQAIIIAFGFCAAVGLIFGYYPAQKAAKMNPIVALGHE